jgi:hypothetical protein
MNVDGNGQKGCSRSTVWLETIKEPVGAHASLLESKVIRLRARIGDRKYQDI